VILGISAADGHVQWQVAASPRESLYAYAPGLVDVTSTSGGTWQDELNPATGRVRWQVASPYNAIATAAGIVTGRGADGTVQISVHDALTGRTRWTARLAGLNGGWPQEASTLPVFPTGPFLVVPAAGPGGSHLLAAVRIADGQRAWQVTIRAPVAAPPLLVPGGMLIYCATVRHNAP
jgi:outer membrane protein assembly factor BamB